MIEKIVILKPKKSLNFSESINAGIRNSKNNKIFIANDDIILSKKTVERLADKCDENTICGPDSNCNVGWITDQPYTVKGVRLLPAMLPNQVEEIIEDIYNIVPTNDKIPKYVDWLAFFATMIHRKTIEDVGLLDENFIYDKEDLDFCVRAKEKGKKFLYCLNSYCFHFGGVSRKVKHKELGMKHLEDNSKNETYFQEKYKLDKKIIGFYCSNAWEYWDESSLNGTIQNNKPKGIGGSETQIILLSRELTKLGYRVKIFNKCREQHYDREGYDVEYISFNKFGEYSKKIHYDYFISSRYLDCFDVPFSSSRNFAMVHDIFLIMGERHKHDVKKDRIEKYFCLSHKHKQFVHEYHDIPLSQIVITSNGLDFTRFDKKVEKNRYQMIYSSSPDRGLELLLSLFPKVKALVPEAKLDVYYGFENFQDQEYIKKIMGIIDNTAGVTYHGRVGQDELAKAFLQSTVWAYTSGFQETFCITALESMASKCVPVTSEFWGLIDTIKDGGIMLPMNNDPNTVFTSQYQDRWISECVKLLKDDEYLKEWQVKGFKRVKRFTWYNVAKQWDDFFKGHNWDEIQI